MLYTPADFVKCEAPPEPEPSEDPGAGRIEACATTSRMKFVDDVERQLEAEIRPWREKFPGVPVIADVRLRSKESAPFSTSNPAAWMASTASSASSRARSAHGRPCRATPAAGRAGGGC